MRMHKDYEWRAISPAPTSDVLAAREVGALGNLPCMGPSTQVAENRQPLAAKHPRFSPSLAGRAPILRIVVPTPEYWNRERSSERFEVTLDYALYLAGQFVARDENGGLRSHTAAGDVVQEQVKDTFLRSLLRLVTGRPLHRLLGLPE